MANLAVGKDDLHAEGLKTNLVISWFHDAGSVTPSNQMLQTQQVYGTLASYAARKPDLQIATFWTSVTIGTHACNQLLFALNALLGTLHADS